MYETLYYIALISGFFPALIYGTNRDLKNPIVPFLFLTLIASIYELIFSTILEINTSYWFQVYSLFEFLTIVYFFSILNKNKLFSMASLVVLIIVYSISFFYWSTDNALIAKTINKFPLTIYVIISFIIWTRQLFKENKIDNLWHHPDFYFVSALAIYYFSTALLFLMSHFLFSSKAYFLNFWLLNIIAVIILRTLLSVGVWKTK